MKRLIKGVWAKATGLGSALWRIMLLLTLGLFLKTLAVVCWDIGAATLLIEKHRLFAIGADFMIVALLMAFTGCFLWQLERRKGNGAIGPVVGCILMASLFLYLFDQFDYKGLTDALFILKYVFYAVFTIAFWSVAGRFVAERFTSLKFLSLFSIELLSFALVGGGSVLLNLSPFTALLIALFAMIGFALVLKTIAQLAPVPTESFVRKTDGIQNIMERPLVSDILTLSFLGTLARALSEAVLYTKLASTGIMPMTVLGLVWFLFGILGLFILGVLYHTRYIYTTLAGMFVLGGSVIATGMAALDVHSGPVATGYLIFLLGSHFYLRGFMRILPRILLGGVGTRLKKRIMTAATPLAFVATGSICLNTSAIESAYALTACGALLIFVTMHATVLYSHILYRMVKVRFWCRGPLMLSDRKICRYLVKLLRHRDEDDPIYALCVLKEGNHPLYEQALRLCMRHRTKQVRIFALTEIQKHYRFLSYHPTFRTLFKKEKEQAVKNRLLTNLILSADNPKKYLSYLSDKKLRAGAVGAFMKLEKAYTDTATETLSQMLKSKNVRDNLSALSLIAESPNRRYVPLVEPLLKHPANAVVRQALLAAGALKDPVLLNPVLRALDDPERQETALMALKSFGKAALPPIEKMIMRNQTPTLRRKQLILFLGALPSGEGKQILLRAIGIENQKLKKTLIQNILDSGIVWVQRDKKTILKNGLKKDLDRMAFLLHLREQFINAPTHESEEAFAFFLQAVQEDIIDTRDLILYQLLLLEPNDIFTRAVRVLLSDSYELYLPAMGVVQDLLPNRLYQKLKPILILPLAQRKKNTLIGLSPDEAAQALSAVIIKPPFAFNHWIRATALYALRRLGSEKGIPLAEEALTDPHPIVLEAAVWTLVRLQADKEALHQKLLTIPTSRLSRLSLDKILES